MSKLQDRQLEAEEYIREHKLLELFTDITSHLVFKKPENPKTSIIEYLEHLKKTKTAGLAPPNLIEEANLQSIFGMLDPSGKGSITYSQYCEAMQTLAIKEFDLKPAGAAEDGIKFDVFLKEAKMGLFKLNQNFKV